MDRPAYSALPGLVSAVSARCEARSQSVSRFRLGIANTLKIRDCDLWLEDNPKTHGGNTMPTDHVAPPWAIHSTLVAVADLDRSIAFYRELGPFDEIVREDAVAVLGDVSPASIALILRETRGIYHTRHGQQSLGLRSIAFNVGSLAELDHIESVLRGRDLFTSRRQMVDGASELVSGRDPDNSPLVFVCYADGVTLGPDYYRQVTSLMYSLDA